MATQSNIPWRRLLVEGATIVVSILLAFAIDAWWANANNRAEEARLLSSLNQELASNIALLEHNVEFRNAIRSSSSLLLSTAEGATDALGNEELDRHIGSLVWWSVTDVSTGVYDAITLSGKLSLISDESLRAEIASLRSSYGLLETIERQSGETFSNSLMPYLYTHAHIPQLSNAQPDPPGPETDRGAQPTLPVLTKRDHQPLLSDPEFIGIVTHYYWDQNDAHGMLLETISRLEHVSALIDAAVR